MKIITSIPAQIHSRKCIDTNMPIFPVGVLLMLSFSANLEKCTVNKPKNDTHKQLSKYCQLSLSFNLTVKNVLLCDSDHSELLSSREDLNKVYEQLMEPGSFVVHADRTRGNRHKLKYRKFCQPL